MLDLELLQAFKQAAYIPGKYYSMTATVRDVKKETQTCSVEPINSPNYPSNDNWIEGVRLTANNASKGTYLVYPKKGSQVIISWLNNTECFINIYSEIDEITIATETYTFGEGKNKGLVKVTELVDKINKLENTVNSLTAILKSVVITVPPLIGIVYPFLPLFSSVTTIPNTQVKELENDKVIH
jgi:hypothetical protein